MEGNKMKRSYHIQQVIIVFCLVSFGLRAVVAQENTDALGGMAYGTGGSVSYSIGQIDYESASGTGGSITEGLQQPYEIMVISGIEDNDINLAFAVFPNPTADFVVLSIQNANTLNMTYALLDIEGKLIEKQEVNGSQTTIAMKDLANGIYFIKVLNKSTEVKIFKVIKNN
jgi:hypothetical protein